MHSAFFEAQSTAFRHSELATLVVDREGIIRAVSPGHVSWLGPRRHRLLGHPWWDLIHRNDLERAVHYVQCIQGGLTEPRVWRVRVRTGAGKWRRVQMTAVPQYDGLVRLLLQPVEVEA